MMMMMIKQASKQNKQTKQIKTNKQNCFFDRIAVNVEKANRWITSRKSYTYPVVKVRGPCSDLSPL